MKVLFVLKKAAYFPYHSSTIRALLKDGHRVQILCPEGALTPFARQELAEPIRQGLVSVGELLARESGWKRAFILNMRELRSYASYLRRSGQSEFYGKRWKSYLSRSLQKLTALPGARRLLASEAAADMFASLEERFGPVPEIVDWLEANKPDVIVASPANMRHSRELEYVKAGKAMAIKTAIGVISWDNLTTKGLFHVDPDLLLVWNESQRKQAVEIHGFAPERIRITGAPFFDKWWDLGEADIGRDAFCRRVDLDPDKPFIAYLGSAASIARDETWLIEALARDLASHPDPYLREMQILVRPHPANSGHFGRLETTGKVRLWPKSGELAGDHVSLSDFYCTLRYGLAAVGLNTSGMLDAVIVDVPCVGIIQDDFRATQEQAHHFRDLMRSEAIYTVRSSAELAGLLRDLLDGKDHKRSNRRSFVRSFVRPNGLHSAAGAHAAAAICSNGSVKTIWESTHERKAEVVI